MAIIVVLLLSGCAFLPYQYNNNLSPSENAHYRQLHIENAQRAGAAMRQWSHNQQQLEQQKYQNNGNTQCRWGGEVWSCNSY